MLRSVSISSAQQTIHQASELLQVLFVQAVPARGTLLTTVLEGRLAAGSSFSCHCPHGLLAVALDQAHACSCLTDPPS